MEGIACTIERLGRLVSINIVDWTGVRLIKIIETWEKNCVRLGLRFKVVTLIGGGCTKKRVEMPISVITGRTNEVMITYTLETGGRDGGCDSPRLSKNVLTDWGMRLP